MKKEKKIVLPFGDDNQIKVSAEPIDCSRLGFFDELEEECWELVKKYCEFLGIELLPGEDHDEDEDVISWDVAKGVQDHILDVLEKAGVKFRFSSEEEKGSSVSGRKLGQLIAIDGNIYEYGGLENFEYGKGELFLKVYAVDVDEEGILTATYNARHFSDKELSKGLGKVEFTQKQWRGIVEHFIRQDYNLTEARVIEAAEDIVGRCFSYGIPKFENLAEYIAKYLKNKRRRTCCDDVEKIHKICGESEATAPDFVLINSLASVYQPQQRGIVTGEEIRQIKSALQFDRRTVLSLRNLRNAVVMMMHAFGDDAMDKVSAITHVIDSELLNRGEEI